MQQEAIVNPIPPVVIVLCLFVIGVELVLSAGTAGLVGGPLAIGWRLAAMQDYAFSSAVIERVVGQGDFSFNIVKRFVTYGFVHASFTQALFAAALLLALGKFVGDVFRATSVLIIVFGSLIFGSSPVWIAELAGFAFGFGASTVVAPGGWTALLEKLRERS